MIGYVLKGRPEDGRDAVAFLKHGREAVVLVHLVQLAVLVACAIIVRHISNI